MRSLALGGGAPSASEEADRFYADRANLASARRAAGLWTAQLAADPRDFEAAWKLARADYWLGGHAPPSERRRFLEDGVEAGRKAVAAAPGRPDGHFWMAANMGALAESFGIRVGLRYRRPIRDALETVLRIDPGFLQGSADRALGRWYAQVPGLFGGDDALAERHLRRSLTYDPRNTASHFFLAEILLDMKRTDAARAELQAVLDAPLNPEWIPEGRDFKEKARLLLERITAN